MSSTILAKPLAEYLTVMLSGRYRIFRSSFSSYQIAREKCRECRNAALSIVIFGFHRVARQRQINFFGGDLFANSAVFAVLPSKIPPIREDWTARTALFGKNTRVEK